MIGRIALGFLLSLGAAGIGFSVAADKAPSVVPTVGGSTATAIFAGGCFWCTESDFEKVPGVISAESGYTDGKQANPTYEQVSNGGTGHVEAVRVSYDPSAVSYAKLVEYFWHTIDPTVKDQQFCDFGNQYRSAIFWHDEAEKKIAEESRDGLISSGKFKSIQTQIAAASTFYPAEEYHQDYYKKNPIRYNYYRSGCGRDARLEEIWGKK